MVWWHTKTIFFFVWFQTSARGPATPHHHTRAWKVDNWSEGRISILHASLLLAILIPCINRCSEYEYVKFWVFTRCFYRILVVTLETLQSRRERTESKLQFQYLLLPLCLVVWSVCFLMIGCKVFNFYLPLIIHIAIVAVMQAFTISSKVLLSM